MTITQQLQNEMNEMNAKRKAVIAANTVESNFPVSKKTFTYRKQTIITGLQAIV